MRLQPFAVLAFKDVVGGKRGCWAACKAGELLVNRAVAEATRILKEGDRVEVFRDNAADAKQRHGTPVQVLE